MAKVVYFTQTNQTKKFVEKVDGFQAIELKTTDFEIKMKEPFILIMPSYEMNVFPIVIDTASDFLETDNNLAYCKGLFGGGNRNFADLFCITAKTLAKDYEIPLLHTFEFQGTPLDVKKLEEVLNQIENDYERTN